MDTSSDYKGSLDTEIVTLLLDHGELDVNVRDFEGFTPLICAANQGHRKVVKLLLADHRTDVNLQVKRGLLAGVFSLRLNLRPQVEHYLGLTLFL